MSSNKPFNLNFNYQGNPSSVIFIAIILFLLIALFTSFYTIDPEQQGVVLRFGKHVGTTEAGLNVKLPFGIDKVIKVDTTTIRKEEFGFRTFLAGVNSTFNREGFEGESLMLTGDLNVADVQWTVQYRVNDPFKFIFKMANVSKAIRDLSESQMRLAVGDRTVTGVITTQRTIIASVVTENLQKALDSYDFGVKIINVILKDVNPPSPVKPSFNEVNEAKQEQERMVNEGWQEYNRKVPEAKGQAQLVVQNAEGYALERVNRAKGDADRFTRQTDEYKKAPEITKQRLYLEGLAEIYGQAKQIYVVDPAVKNVVPFLQANSPTTEPVESANATAQPASKGGK